MGQGKTAGVFGCKDFHLDHNYMCVNIITNNSSFADDDPRNSSSRNSIKSYYYGGTAEFYDQFV